MTVQRSFITHPLVTSERRPDGRGFGSLVRGSDPDRQDYAQGSNYSSINNLWAHCRSRAPRPGNYVHYEEAPVGPLFDFRNNVIYNWGRDRASETYDQQVVHEVRSGTGNLIDEDNEVGGLPDLRPALNPVDSNDNGIPDWWQIQFGLGPESELNPAGDMNGSGYANIEEYLNGTDLEKYIEYKIIRRH